MGCLPLSKVSGQTDKGGKPSPKCPMSPAPRRSERHRRPPPPRSREKLRKEGPSPLSGFPPSGGRNPDHGSPRRTQGGSPCRFAAIRLLYAANHSPQAASVGHARQRESWSARSRPPLPFAETGSAGLCKWNSHRNGSVIPVNVPIIFRQHGRWKNTLTQPPRAASPARYASLAAGR